MSQHIPKHIGIIMDGNRRWAKERGMTASEGHAAGVENLMTMLPPLAPALIRTAAP